jgi:hypothetical protein
MRAPSHMTRRWRRRARRWPLPAASCLLALVAAPALAEFEIQESTIDEGEIQLQYRAAQHGGLPRGGSGDVDVLPDDEEAPLRQSHEFEIQMSITSHWLIAVTHGFDKLDNDDLNLTALEAESQIEIITLEGDGFGLAIQGGFEKAVQAAARTEPSDVHFGPILEFSKDKFLLTLNPLFFKERGPNADQDGLGFEYGWQARYQVTPRLSLALESFGEIQDMADGSPFNEQEHSIGPAFYYTFGEADEEAKKGAELTVSFGGQFGLTDATSDAALKVFIGYEFF